jgi:thioredoxin-like negative regulator of GroEL
MLGTSLHPACEDALQLAQNDYLRGNWFEAEATLLDVLQQQPRDAEATLLLVSVLRHTKRWQPALRRLGQLVLLESAQRWAEEIEREKRLIMRAMEEAGGAEHEVQLEEHEDLSAENLAVEGVENDAYIASQFPDDQLEGVELQVSERPAEIEIRRVA